MVAGANIDAQIQRDVPPLLAIEPTRFWWFQSSEPVVTGWGRVSTDPLEHQARADGFVELPGPVQDRVGWMGSAECAVERAPGKVRLRSDAVKQHGFVGVG